MTSAFQSLAPNQKAIVLGLVCLALCALLLGFFLLINVELQNSPADQEPKVPDSCVHWIPSSSPTT